MFNKLESNHKVEINLMLWIMLIARNNKILTKIIMILSNFKMPQTATIIIMILIRIFSRLILNFNQISLSKCNINLTMTHGELTQQLLFHLNSNLETTIMISTLISIPLSHHLIHLLLIIKKQVMIKSKITN